MINGFVGFQLYEDGTTLSVWLLRICSLSMFIISFVVALLTFKGWGGLSPDSTVALFVVVYIFSAIFLFVYIVMQIMLVMGTLQERWPLWHIGFGVAAFVIGQILLYAFSETICDNVQHYMDGLFFATLLNLLAVMMVYKVNLRPSVLSFFKLTNSPVLGRHHPRRPRIFRRPTAKQLGGQGSSLPRRRLRCSPQHLLRQLRLRLQQLPPATVWPPKQHVRRLLIADFSLSISSSLLSKQDKRGNSYFSNLSSFLFFRPSPENSRLNFYDSQIFFRCSVIILHPGRRFSLRNDSITLSLLSASTCRQMI